MFDNPVLIGTPRSRHEAGVRQRQTLSLDDRLPTLSV
jgi:hypothetical protein